MRAAAVRCRIRPMVAGDIPQVMDIERESFPSMWPQTAYRRELQNRLARYLVVAETPFGSLLQSIEPAPPHPPGWRDALRRLLGRQPEPPTSELLLGFAGMWMMLDEAHIVTLAVREACRRQGIGEMLLIACIDLALEEGQRLMTLEVRRSNDVAQKLYEKYGLARVGLRPRYYSDNGEDAVLMTTPPLADADFLARYRSLKDDHRRRHEELYPEG